MSDDVKVPTDNIVALFEAIVKHIPGPVANPGTPQVLITSLDYSSYVGRIAIGRIHRGELSEGMNVSLVKHDGSVKRCKIKELHTFTGLGHQKVDQMISGDICAMVGIEGFDIGDTVCDYENPEPLDPIAVDEPTMSMLFMINNSPFYGKEGKYVTSRHLKDRLEKELEKNLALRVLPTDSADSYTVYGRGVLHLSILIETMRREGYELQVGQPQVLFKEIDGERCEPIEELHVDVPDEYSGKVVEMASMRKGEMQTMERKGDRIHLEFLIPSRGIIGMRTNMLTATAGEAVINHRFVEYQPYKGSIDNRGNGSLIALETGAAFAYSISKLQDRGSFFIDPGQDVYEGQVIGESSRGDDLTINVTKPKKLTNMRASGSDDKLRLVTPIKFSLEEALEYIKSDELVEVTPVAIRMRKIFLKEHDRKRLAKNS
jgi:GTP-binding protein